jgi:hypothetical protein
LPRSQNLDTELCSEIQGFKSALSEAVSIKSILTLKRRKIFLLLLRIEPLFYSRAVSNVVAARAELSRLPDEVL